MPVVQSPLSKAAATIQQEIRTSPSAPRNDKLVSVVVLLTKTDNHNSPETAAPGCVEIDDILLPTGGY